MKTITLLHGTTEEVARRAMGGEGLRPRGANPGNWTRTVTSNPSCVYLTDSYAAYFAMSACDGKGRWGIVEAEVSVAALLPDEDFLEQVTRYGTPELPPRLAKKLASAGTDMVRRTLFFRKHAHEWRTRWPLSLKRLGTVCHEGPIPASAIRRVAIIDPREAVLLNHCAADPAITILNYAILGDKYRALMRHIFDGGVSTGEIDPFLDDEHLARMEGSMLEMHRRRRAAFDEQLRERTGITILERKEAVA